MKRKTHLFLVAVDEDPVPGAFDGTRIFEDVKGIIKRNIISAYEPRVVGLGRVTRESNFLNDAKIELSMSLAEVFTDENGDRDIANIILSSPIVINYAASRNEILGEGSE